MERALPRLLLERVLREAEQDFALGDDVARSVGARGAVACDAVRPIRFGTWTRTGPPGVAIFTWTIVPPGTEEPGAGDCQYTSQSGCGAPGTVSTSGESPAAAISASVCAWLWPKQFGTMWTIAGGLATRNEMTVPTGTVAPGDTFCWYTRYGGEAPGYAYEP